MIFSIKKDLSSTIIIFGENSSLISKKIVEVAAAKNGFVDLELSDESLKDVLASIKKTEQVFIIFGELNDNYIKYSLDIAKNILENGILVISYDDFYSRLKDMKTKAKIITYGMGERADFLAGDVNKSSQGLNFKIINGGKIIPFWIKDAAIEKEIMNILPAVALAAANNMNLVEISQNLQNSK